MKIRSLNLTAFGPFTGRELVFAGEGIPAGALQVVYGPNEAGKSTALRAVSGLLFGIDHQTSDAFQHSMADLRLGAVLEGTDGSVVELVRRKGKKNTLLDRAGNVVEEGLLRRLCGSATEATFRALFGLDHVSLREGAEALLAGQGDVGESLFEAALGGGGRGIHRILQDLESEADALFTPKAHKRKLNEAINAYQEARDNVRLKARSGEGWMKQKRGLEEAKAEHQRLAELLRARKRELHRLERARRLLPLGVRRDRLLQIIAALGGATLLAADATKLRETALSDRQRSAAELARLAAEIAELTVRRDALTVPHWLEDPAVARLNELPDRLGAHRKAADDRPRLLGALATYEVQAEALAAEVHGNRAGLPGPANVVDATEASNANHPQGTTASLQVAERARVRELSHLEAGHVQRRRQAKKALDDGERRQRARAAELAQLPPDRDSTALRRVLRRVEREGDLDTRWRAAVEEQARLSAELARLMATLGLSGAPSGAGLVTAAARNSRDAATTADHTAPARLLALVVPSPEGIDKFAGELQKVAARDERLTDEVSELNGKARAAQRKLADLSRRGDVPSLETLAEARAARDLAWATLRSGPDVAGARDAGAAGGATWQERLLTFEGASARADQAADRLLREADRVASAANIAHEREELNRHLADAEVQRNDLARRSAAAVLGWNALWATVGVEPQGPDEMRAWLRRFGDAREVAHRLEKTTGETSKLEQQVRRARADLGAAMGEQAAGNAGGPNSKIDSESGGAIELAVLCERAEQTARLREETSARRAALLAEVTRLREDVALAQAELQDAEAMHEGWRLQWAAALAPLGLPASASAAEAEAVLEVASALALKQSEVTEVRRRLQSIDRDAQQFQDTVGALVAVLGPDLADRAIDESAEIMLRRHRDGLQAQAARAGMEEDLRRRTAAQRVAALAHADAEARLQALARAAGVADLAALEDAERRSTEMREVRRQLQDSEDQILAVADGLTLEAALREIPARAPSPGEPVTVTAAEDLDDRIERLGEELETLDQETQEANRAIGSTSAGLLLWEDAGEAGAAAAADEAQAQLARIRALAEEYARLRLATRLLSREIERYRDQHQGPLLLRASALLARLTLGRYTALRADFDESDRPVLRCLRADGSKVSVEGLSDGTRDQLYLALRLATLERQAVAAEPLPLILDDILIHFDDARAGAALGVLAEHAKATQVVLFTHHARIVDLAQRMLPADSLRVSRLEG